MELTSEKDVLQVTAASDFDLHVYMTQFIERFSDLVFQPGFGFDGFRLADIQNFLTMPDVFALSFNREKGKSILYGLDHVKTRQSLLNQLPQSMVLPLMMEKFSAVGIVDQLEQFSGQRWGELSSVKDIGMGHSVYLLSFGVGEGMSQFVLKRKRGPLQVFFCDLLGRLDFVSYPVHYFENEFGTWEISAYLGDDALSYTDLLLGDTEELELKLARHAAFGDVLGLGDRHFENYLKFGGDLVSLDVTYLFWPDNEAWTERYISGGAYELSLMVKYMHDEVQLQYHLSRFWDTYYETLVMLESRQDIVMDSVGRFFCDAEASQYRGFVSSRLESVDRYFEQQRHRGSLGLVEMFHRQVYKDILGRLYQTVQRKVFTNDLLKMYYLANLNRFNTFLHLESSKKPVFSQIEALSLEVFSLGEGYFDEARSRRVELVAFLKSEGFLLR